MLPSAEPVKLIYKFIFIFLCAELEEEEDPSLPAMCHPHHTGLLEEDVAVYAAGEIFI